MPGGASQTPAIVLLSGGLDSATVLAIARHAGHACHCLSFDYGQRHRAELAAASAVADQLGAVTHRTAAIDLRAFGGSALTSDTIDVPKDRDANAMADGIPVTYVPARNTIFLSYALALAEVLDASAIYLGINAVDYSGYPDCRPEYLAAFQSMADLATKAGVEGHGVRIHAPLLTLTKTQIIQRGLDLGVDYGLTHSCYDPIPDPSHPLGYRPCGQCDACLLRKAAFEKLGMTDPVLG
ncbi:MAG: 7-cyano-7-deazaguanine synthase QueC [Planctomycetota bacterium]